MATIESNVISLFFQPIAWSWFSELRALHEESESFFMAMM
jgi:hypothetical protein